MQIERGAQPEVWVTHKYKDSSGQNRTITFCVDKPGMTARQKRRERKEIMRAHPEWVVEQKKLAYEFVQNARAQGIRAFLKTVWIQRRLLIARIGVENG